MFQLKILNLPLLFPKFMNPFFIILFILLALWLVLNLPFIFFYLFSGVFSLFRASSSQEEFDRSLVVYNGENTNSNSNLNLLLLPTALFAGLTNIFQNLYHSLHWLFTSAFALFFGWQFLQQLILFGNASRWGVWDWLILVICSLVGLFILSGIFTKPKAEVNKNRGFVIDKPYNGSNSKK